MKPTVRRVVVAALLTAQLLTLLLILATSGRISADAEAEHTETLLDRAAAEAVDHTRDYLEPADSLVATTADMIATGAVDTGALERAFLGELDRTPQLASVYVGADDGSFFFVSREGPGYLVKTIRIDGSDRVVELVHLDHDLEVIDTELTPDDPFDPRERPWFREAIADGTTTAGWTDPYVFYTSEQLGVTASAAVVDGDDRLVVVGADIELGSLSIFLQSLRIGPTGGSLIIDDMHTVLAHPDPSLVQDTSGETPATVHVGDFADPVTRAAVGALVAEGTTEVATAVFATDEGSAQAAFRTIGVGEGTWTVGVHASEGALVRSLSNARSDERLLMIGIGLVSLVLLAAVAFPASRPLAHLEHRATTDSLTGLLNRGTILEHGDRIAAEPGMHATIMIDLDNFKLINDTHGHPVGDEVIREVANRITGVLRSTDQAGRIGGEEFLVILGDTTPTLAHEVAERVRSAIRSQPVTTSAGQLEMTSSIGLAVATGPTDLQHSLAVADTALLEAKHEGRDRLVSGGVVPEPASS